MADYSWPEADRRAQIGARPARLDGPVKSTGFAKYPSDQNPSGLLAAKILTSPHAHARIVAIDTSAAEAMAGVRVVHVIQGEGSEIQWAGDEIAAVAAVSEDVARDALRAIRVDYEVLPHFVTEEDRDRAPGARAAGERAEGDPDAAFATAHRTVERTLGMPQMAHMCLEPHGQVCSWDGDELEVHASTQAVSTLAGQFATELGVPASQVRIRTEYMGGGFGSKFSPDRWGIVGAELARKAGAPVKLFLERDQEVTVAGSRPSAFARIRAAADEQGRLVAWDSDSWGSGGLPGTGQTPLPYVFSRLPNRRTRHTSVPTNLAGSRAWRAPNHPQACFLTMAVLDDLADELGLDPIDFLERNLDLTGRPDTYREQLGIAAEMASWKERWQPRGRTRAGAVQRGLGVSVHTWGGRGHSSNCDVTVHPDGAVEARIGSQDIGTGTRTIVAQVLAETFGLELHQVRVSLGDNVYPQSGPSGGSSTVGGVTASTRRAAQDALREVLVHVAPRLEAEPEQLLAEGGRVFVDGDSSRGVSWREAAAQIGGAPISVQGRNPGRGRLISSGVGGVQIAEVEVDIDTGVVHVERMIAVQDCGLIINRRLAESQVYGGLIMGVGYALYEEWIPDPVSGRLLNADMEFYKLAGLVDVGSLEVHMMTGPGYDERGVIGLGEPPVISPGAAISNAVANAIGVRVPYLPLTPDRVLDALAGRGGPA
ncbi:MAG: xanthine dehydrogenase family protein molybdopterin-binding subunit [Holophagales bacterium]|nr:xanthine dehydrogenase family protein molybdopterin-binding subunit [Holophagales bacterium]MYH24346.1 xanthine dehydrogenase family protein molybdopterin-binding subunit [Holophagales bacterium]